MIKRISLLVRKPEVSREEFIRHWRGLHAQLAQRVPGMIGYKQDLVIGNDKHPHLPSEGRQIDGIAETFFETQQSMEAALKTPEAQAMLADGATFIATVTTFVVEETVFIGA